MSEATPLLELRGVRAAYDRIDVLFGVDLAVAEGSVVALLGPNGAGKTTLLKVACGLMPATAGDVLFAGRRVNGVRPEALARLGHAPPAEALGAPPRELLDWATRHWDRRRLPAGRELPDTTSSRA